MTLSKLLVAILLLPATALPGAEPQTIPLWANGAPGSEARRHEPEQAASYWVRNVHNPSVTVFLPPKDKATGAALVIAPGGGHRELGFVPEGIEAARYFNGLGVAVFALKYRLAREEGSTYQIENHGRADGLRAMRVVRSRAAEFGVDPKRIGFLGFSAGGEILSQVVYQPNAGDPTAADPIDRVSARPDFQIMVYSGARGIPETIPADTPPVFLVSAADDRGPAQAIATVLPRFLAARVPVEVHLFARGGHAFNMGSRSRLATLKNWPERLHDWMKDNSVLDPDPAKRAAK